VRGDGDGGDERTMSRAAAAGDVAAGRRQGAGTNGGALAGETRGRSGARAGRPGLLGGDAGTNGGAASHGGPGVRGLDAANGEELVASGDEMPPPLPWGDVELPPSLQIPRRVGAGTGRLLSWQLHPLDLFDSVEDMRLPKKNPRDRHRSSGAQKVDDSMASNSEFCPARRCDREQVLLYGWASPCMSLSLFLLCLFFSFLCLLEFTRVSFGFLEFFFMMGHAQRGIIVERGAGRGWWPGGAQRREREDALERAVLQRTPPLCDGVVLR